MLVLSWVAVAPVHRPRPAAGWQKELMGKEWFEAARSLPTTLCVRPVFHDDQPIFSSKASTSRKHER